MFSEQQNRHPKAAIFSLHSISLGESGLQFAQSACENHVRSREKFSFHFPDVSCSIAAKTNRVRMPRRSKCGRFLPAEL
jgi:hypothetical protein